MKLKPGWEKLTDEKMPKDLRDRIARRMGSELEARREVKPGWLASLRLPAMGLGLAAAAAVAIVIVRQQPTASPTPAGISLRDDPEMVRNAEMFYDLRVLEKLGKLRELEKKKWPKTKS